MARRVRFACCANCPDWNAAAAVSPATCGVDGCTWPAGGSQILCDPHLAEVETRSAAASGKQDTATCGRPLVNGVGTFTCDKPRGHKRAHCDSRALVLWTEEAEAAFPPAADKADVTPRHIARRAVGKELKRHTCPNCGRSVAVRIPRGGDGRDVVTVPHGACGRVAIDTMATAADKADGGAA
jgi:hypothetical protein